MATKSPFVAKNGLTVGTTNVFGTNAKLNANNAITDGTITVSMLQETPVSNTTFQSALANTNAKLLNIESNLLSTNTDIRLYIDNEITALVNAAPSTLDTLNELAAALGNNENFAVTLTTNLDQKLGATATITLTGDITGSGSFSSNAVTITTVDINLANTNAYIASVQSNVETNEATELAHLANTNAYIGSVDSTRASNLANTNAYIAAVLANTNAYIASVNTTYNDALANTNAYIASVQSDVDTNEATELAHLANTNAYIGSVDSTRASDLANTNVYIAAVELQERQALANTNAYIDTKVDTTTFNSALANTNAYIASIDSSRASDLANTNGYIAFVDNTRASDLANTNAYIASVQLDVDNNESQERQALANTNAYIASVLANTNSYIGSVDSARALDLANTNVKLLNIESNLLGTNTEIRSLVTGSYVTNTAFQSALANTNAYIAFVLENAGEVSNAYLTSTFTTNTAFQSALANTNAYIGSVDSTRASDLANTNIHINAVELQERQALANTNTKLLNIESNLLGTNTAIRSLVSGSYVTNTAFQSALANTNAYIAFVLENAGEVSNAYLTSTFTTNTAFQSALANTNAKLLNIESNLLGTNTAIRSLVSGSYVSNTTFQSALANTNVYIATKVNTTTFNSALANTNLYINTKVDNTTLNLALANTNAYIGSVNSTRASDLANTNAYIGSVDSTRASNLANTNLAISDRLQVANAQSLFVNVSGDTMTGFLTLHADPTSAFHAATKEYVDTVASASLHYHNPVRVESPVALTATYNNGTSGVGATLTNSGTQAALVIDGVTLNVADRVLIYEQTNAAHNGVYTVTNTGSVSTNWVLTRATDADSAAPSDPDALGLGDAFFVQEGNTGAGELYVMNTEGTITFGTTNITFTQISSAAIYSAGTDLNLSGVTFSLNDQISANTTGNAATATQLATARSIALGGDVTGSASFNGTQNITITATVADDSHNHIISNVDGLQTALNGKVSVNANFSQTANTLTSASATQQVVDSWSTSTYISAKYICQVKDSGSSDRQVSEVLVVHDGSSSYLTEYAIVDTGGIIATFQTSISGGNVRLLVTPTVTNSVIKVVRFAVTA
jgi:hypothetical protein